MSWRANPGAFNVPLTVKPFVTVTSPLKVVVPTTSKFSDTSRVATETSWTANAGASNIPPTVKSFVIWTFVAERSCILKSPTLSFSPLVVHVLVEGSYTKKALLLSYLTSIPARSLSLSVLMVNILPLISISTILTKLPSTTRSPLIWTIPLLSVLPLVGSKTILLLPVIVFSPPDKLIDSTYKLFHI